MARNKHRKSHSSNSVYPEWVTNWGSVSGSQLPQEKQVDNAKEPKPPEQPMSVNIGKPMLEDEFLQTHPHLRRKIASSTMKHMTLTPEEVTRLVAKHCPDQVDNLPEMQLQNQPITESSHPAPTDETSAMETDIKHAALQAKIGLAASTRCKQI